MNHARIDPAHAARHGHEAHRTGHRHPVATPATGPAGDGTPGLTRMAFLATLHCLAGCAVGEVLGMVLGTAIGLGNGATIVLAVVLAFAFGYAFTIVPLRRAGLGWRAAARLALAADTASIAVMEVVDSAVMWWVPGAMDAPLSSGLLWGALAGSLLVSLFAAWPVNRWLLARGRGHARVHGPAHGHGHGHVRPAAGRPVPQPGPRG